MTKELMFDMDENIDVFCDGDKESSTTLKDDSCEISATLQFLKDICDLFKES